MRLNVEFRKGVVDCYLEKEVFSRTIWIVSEAVEKSKRTQRRRELLSYFSGILDRDQADQIINLLQKLDEKSRKKIRKDFLKYKEILKIEKDKKKS